MIKLLKKNRFLIARRIVQLGLLLAFAGTNWWGWKFLMGTYSSAFVLETFYLADPYAVIQTLAAGFLMSTDAIVGAVIVLIFYALIAGRSFCSWVCPVNIITDLATWMQKN
jgi:ferredoxin-type protein NapH